MADIELTDAQIVEVLASLGIDSEKSKYGFDVPQVHTTVPGIREIFKAYSAAIAEQAKGQAAPVLAVKTWKERADEDSYHNRPVERAFVYMEAEIIDLRAALATCAEEARREGYEQGRFDEQMAQGPSREEWARIAAEKDGQRTAGGDAVKACSGCYGMGDREEYSCSDCDGTGRVPVAEAAAQADDWQERNFELGRAMFERDAAPTAQPTPTDAEIDEIIYPPRAFLKAEDWDSTTKRPKAQPTPKENAPTLADRGVDEIPAQAVTSAEASLAQPTPPDDERAAFESWLKKEWPMLTIDYAPINGFYKGDDGAVIQDKLEGWMARAALRQPGALPDGGNTGGGETWPGNGNGTMPAFAKPRPWPGPVSSDADVLSDRAEDAAKGGA